MTNRDFVTVKYYRGIETMKDTTETFVEITKCTHDRNLNQVISRCRPHPVLDRDFVNTKKPSALKALWNRHGDSVRFWVIVGLIILTSSVTVC